VNVDPQHVFHAICAVWLFVIGSLVGSFVNVCIYRIPWQKSILWPASHCPRCLVPIAARDNVPILGWLLLGGRCRTCKLPISVRYPLIEALVGALFVGVYVTDVVLGANRLLDTGAFLRMGYHDVLVTLLVIATFLDYDHFIIPDEVTVTGMILGLGLGVLFPWIRPEPAAASDWLGGLTTGLIGWAAGGALVWAFRIGAGVVFRREAMGFGDVTLLAMIGSFLGWQAAIMTFFLAPFFGLAHALAKLVRLLVKWMTRRKISGSDREVPFGPYLSLAAVTLLLSWPRLWPGWTRPLFATLADLIGWMIGG
jgi:leader peptidase (prepilin peptidase)/N-methyltransferase